MCRNEMSADHDNFCTVSKGQARRQQLPEWALLSRQHLPNERCSHDSSYGMGAALSTVATQWALLSRQQLLNGSCYRDSSYGMDAALTTAATRMGAALTTAPSK
ncbi:unnamed protein product [Caenorhabditis sp. 36 PRJEB53466]|nr:unnamed protein product [Caenorhabditis sp. 36 PRJEB53466]